jgi:hypothetical protein
MADIVLINARFATSYWGLDHALRVRYFEKHAIRRLKYRARLLLETVVLLTRLFRRVREPELRREYARWVRGVVKRRFDLQVLQIYAIRFAMHNHFYQMTAVSDHRWRMFNTF